MLGKSLSSWGLSFPICKMNEFFEMGGLKGSYIWPVYPSVWAGGVILALQSIFQMGWDNVPPHLVFSGHYSFHVLMFSVPPF